MELKEVFQQIFQDSEKAGISRQQLISRAGLHSPAVSRALSVGDCRFSTINKLLKAGGFKLAVVRDNDDADKLVRGELF